MLHFIISDVVRKIVGDGVVSDDDRFSGPGAGKSFLSTEKRHESHLWSELCRPRL